MLRRLSVENYALIDKLDIGFDRGLNIITGETGSGKSILLGALDLILGSRADSSAVRDTSRNCVVEAEFDIAGYDLEPLFAQYDIDHMEQSVVRRVINAAGKSRAYINDIPVQLAALKDIGGRLIDIHSQHQTLLLGDGRFQINILDSVAAHGSKLSAYREKYSAFGTASRQLSELVSKAQEAGKELEYISFQFEQLCGAKLIDGEQEEAEALLSELTHASEIKETMLYAAEVLDGGDDNVLTSLKGIGTSIGRLHDVYPRSAEVYTRLHSVLLELKDIASEVSSEAGRVEANDSLKEKTSERLDMLYALQQKHKVSSVGELIALRDEYDRRLSDISNCTQQIEEQERLVAGLRAEAVKLAGEITAARKGASAGVEKHVTQMLSELGMPSSVIKIDITPADELGRDGADVVRFLFTANKNSALQPIEKVASGGEMSRLMLTLKALVASHTQLPTVIFDEIDSGVSGYIADRMGDIIARLSGSMQVINITHLPQVASKGDTHLLVYKSDTPQGTQTFIRRLEPSERVEHIASMLSGANVTAAAVEQARLLLGLREKK